MNCPKCGVQNIDGVTFCGSCGSQMIYTAPQYQSNTDQVTYSQHQSQQPYGNQYGSPVGGPSNGGMIMPKSYMVESIIITIFSTICCCSPISIILGIIAIVKASNVESEFNSGNINKAIQNADSAKKLTIWALFIIVITPIISFLVSLLLFGSFAAMMENYQQIFEEFNSF